MATQIQPTVISAKLIPAPAGDLRKVYGATKEEHQSIGLLTCNFDHALYVALDEATKASPVSVVYARSMYAGNAYPSGPLSGEVLGVLAGADDSIVREGLKAAIYALQSNIRYEATESANRVIYFSHVISSLGSYLSKEAGLSVGDAMAYLMAPPIESAVGLDAALKTANVRLAKAFAPPTATNYGGGFLAGELNDCMAAAHAFSQSISHTSAQPIDSLVDYSFQRRQKSSQSS